MIVNILSIRNIKRLLKFELDVNLLLIYPLYDPLELNWYIWLELFILVDFNDLNRNDSVA